MVIAIALWILFILYMSSNLVVACNNDYLYIACLVIAMSMLALGLGLLQRAIVYLVGLCVRSMFSVKESGVIVESCTHFCIITAKIRNTVGKF